MSQHEHYPSNDMTHFNIVNIKPVVLVDTNPTLNLLQDPFQPI